MSHYLSTPFFANVRIDDRQGAGVQRDTAACRFRWCGVFLSIKISPPYLRQHINALPQLETKACTSCTAAARFFWRQCGTHILAVESQTVYNLLASTARHIWQPARTTKVVLSTSDRKPVQCGMLVLGAIANLSNSNYRVVPLLARPGLQRSTPFVRL